MACYTEIYAVSNILKKLYIQSNFHTVYKHHLYHYKQDKFDELFDQHHLTVLTYIYHPVLVQVWKQNIYASAYENNLNK